MGRNKWTAIVLLMGIAAGCQAATVRGRLLRGKSVASGIAVTVKSPQNVRSSPARSGADGMYYIPNVKAGSYTLEVWGTPNQVTASFPITVKETQTDVNPIYVK